MLRCLKVPAESGMAGLEGNDNPPPVFFGGVRFKTPTEHGMAGLKGQRHTSLGWSRPRRRSPRFAESPAHSSIPDVGLIVFNPVSIQEHAKLILKRPLCVMLLLLVNVMNQSLQISRAD